MRLLGFRIPFTGRSAPNEKALGAVSENQGGWYRVFESFAGAWQTNYVVDRNTVLSYSAVYACMTLIASDISKLRIKLVAKGEDGVWTETENPAYSQVLRKPNGFQNRIQFIETWVLSKLVRGNAYILKGRDGRGVVNRLWVLDPSNVTPLVSDDGEVFYQLRADNLAGLTSDVVVPAREIIHDRYNCLFHPLVGTSPIFAAGTAATQGVNIQNNSAAFFGNNSIPGGILTAPNRIDPETAARLKTDWTTNFGGTNRGKLAVLGDGLTFSAMSMSAEDAQLIDQLRWTSEVVCSVFHVPPYKIGVGALPSYNNVQALNVEYYAQGLQSLIESIELCLDEGLGMGPNIGTELDLDNLFRMDSDTQLTMLEKAKSVMTLDERRKRLDLKALPTGGDTVYLQQQDHSIEAIAARDRRMIEQQDSPPAPPAAVPAAPPPQSEAASNDNARQVVVAFDRVDSGTAERMKGYAPCPLTAN